MKCKITITGRTQHMKDIKTSKTEIESAIWKALMTEAQIIHAKSKSQVPIRTGTLFESAFMVEKPRLKEIYVGFGKPNDRYNPETNDWASSYAMTVHEDLSKQPASGKRKFLEDPFREFSSDAESKIKSRVGEF